VFRQLLGGELKVEGLGEYYEAHRRDAYDGDTVDGHFDWVPDDREIWLEDTTPPERDAEVEEVAIAMTVMEVLVDGLRVTPLHARQVPRAGLMWRHAQEAVESGDYVETEEGWASTMLNEEQRAAIDMLAARYRLQAEMRLQAARESGDYSGPNPMDVEQFNLQVEVRGHPGSAGAAKVVARARGVSQSSKR